MEQGAAIYRMTFMFDIEGTAPAIAKFRSKNLMDAIFGMMDADQGVRLKAAIAAGDAAQYIRGIAYLGDTEAVTHPFDLELFEQQRNLVLAMAAGADVGSDFADAAALAGLRDRAGDGGSEKGGEGGLAGLPAADDANEFPDSETGPGELHGEDAI